MHLAGTQTQRRRLSEIDPVQILHRHVGDGTARQTALVEESDQIIHGIGPTVALIVEEALEHREHGRRTVCRHMRDRAEIFRGVPEPGDFSEERSEEHTSELQSLMRISYAVFCLKKKKKTH